MCAWQWVVSMFLKLIWAREVSHPSWGVWLPRQAGVSHRILPRVVLVSYDGPAGRHTLSYWQKNTKQRQCVLKQILPKHPQTLKWQFKMNQSGCPLLGTLYWCGSPVLLLSLVVSTHTAPITHHNIICAASYCLLQVFLAVSLFLLWSIVLHMNYFSHCSVPLSSRWVQGYLFPVLAQTEAIPINSTVPPRGRRSGYPIADQWLSQSPGSCRALYQYSFSLVKCTPSSFHFLQLPRWVHFLLDNRCTPLTLPVTTSCWSWEKEAIIVLLFNHIPYSEWAVSCCKPPTRHVEIVLFVIQCCWFE